MIDLKKALKQFKELKKAGGEMRLAAEEWDKPWKTLISTILSARSLDETTIKYATILFDKYDSVEKLARADLKEVEKIIKPINFYRNKSKNIINCCKVLKEKYNSNPPKEFDKLIELPGVGKKTASVFLSEYGTHAIAVDTHVFYISRYLGWSSGNTPDKVMDDLMAFFPTKYWSNLNPVLVRFGKKYTSRKEKNRLLDEINNIN